MESSKEFVRRIVRCLNEWRVVRSLLRELYGVCWENCKVSERGKSCKEFVRRIVMSLTE